ncbi:MAG: PEP-CTERM sorting domain-containing protein [Bryobacteraceae bacterium]
MNFDSIKNKLATAIAAAALTLVPANAGVMVFSLDPTGFDAATTALSTVGFDSIAPGTDISGQTIQGIEFQAPGSPLIVVDAASTATTSGFSGTSDISLNRLFATTGTNVLSPGGTQLAPGPNPALEYDSLTLVFHTPVTAFGLDLLWQQADGATYTDIRVFDSANHLLHSGRAVGREAWTGNGWAGGTDFFGVVATGGTTIGRIEFLELDNDSRYPDSNIGYDSFRMQTAATPEPGSMALLGFGLIGIALVRRRKNVTE